MKKVEEFVEEFVEEIGEDKCHWEKKQQQIQIVLEEVEEQDHNQEEWLLVVG